MTERIDRDRRRLLLLGTAAGLMMASHAQGASSMTTVANTRAGRVRGTASGGVRIFRGIPYGASTAGAARFAPPAPPAPWTGIRDAGRFGDRCVQNPFPEALTGGAEDVPASEDCLSLNVWTPGLDRAARRPVMVWFHGGGFVIGHGGQKRFDGTNLAAMHDVVVVTINHRLGVFGFLGLDAIDARLAGAANAGLLDCIAALGWVRDNIAAFGGDPGNVTAFGQSGGGAKISTLMAMPAATGLFHKAIIQSGSWLKAMTIEEAGAAAQRIMRALDIDPRRPDALRAVPAERLLATANATLGPGLAAFGPVVDGVDLPRHPWTPDAPAPFADIPMIIGCNKDEATLFTLLAGGPDAPDFTLAEADLVPRLAAVLKLPPEPMAELVGLYRAEHPGATASDIFFRATSDASVRVAATLQAERKAAQGRGSVHAYLFAWESPAMDGKLRSAHSAELPFVFANPDANPLNGSGPDRIGMARLMSGIWTRFARTGDPNHAGLPHWKPYDGKDRATIILKPRPEMANDPDGRARALLQRLLPA